MPDFSNPVASRSAARYFLRMLYLELKDLGKAWGLRKALSNVTMSLSAGSLTALIGPNGAGKSTLMRVIAGAETFTAGSGLIAGVALDSAGADRFENVAYVSESTQYDLRLPLHRIVALLAAVNPAFEAGFAASWFRRLNLHEEANFEELSRGQKMQAATVLAIAARPRVFLADEITSVLDPRARETFLRLLAEHATAGNAVMVATNLVTDVESYATHVAVISEGRLLAHESAAELRTRFPGESLTEILLRLTQTGAA
jgi:ABC-2 type transport system ATP-binding protein